MCIKIELNLSIKKEYKMEKNDFTNSKRCWWLGTTISSIYFSPLSMVVTMTEECGEVARIMNHLYGDKMKKRKRNFTRFGRWIGCFVICNYLYSQWLEYFSIVAYKWNLEKIYNRDNNRFKKKSL